VPVRGDYRKTDLLARR